MTDMAAENSARSQFDLALRKQLGRSLYRARLDHEFVDLYVLHRAVQRKHGDALSSLSHTAANIILSDDHFLNLVYGEMKAAAAARRAPLSQVRRRAPPERIARTLRFSYLNNSLWELPFDHTKYPTELPDSNSVAGDKEVEDEDADDHDSEGDENDEAADDDDTDDDFGSQTLMSIKTALQLFDKTDHEPRDRVTLVRSIHDGLTKLLDGMPMLKEIPAGPLLQQLRHEFVDAVTALDATQGKSVVILGETGIGKSFFLNLLLMITEVSKQTYRSANLSRGSITVNRTGTPAASKLGNSSTSASFTKLASSDSEPEEDGIGTATVRQLQQLVDRLTPDFSADQITVTKAMVTYRPDDFPSDTVRNGERLAETLFASTAISTESNIEQTVLQYSFLLPVADRYYQATTAHPIRIHHGAIYQLVIRLLTKSDVVSRLEHVRQAFCNEDDTATAQLKVLTCGMLTAQVLLNTGDLIRKIRSSKIPIVESDLIFTEAANIVLNPEMKALRLFSGTGDRRTHDRMFIRDMLQRHTSDVVERGLILEIHVLAPSQLLRGNSELIDCPGLGDADAFKMAFTSQCVHRADVVLVLLDKHLNARGTTKEFVENYVVPDILGEGPRGDGHDGASSTVRDKDIRFVLLTDRSRHFRVDDILSSFGTVSELLTKRVFEMKDMVAKTENDLIELVTDVYYKQRRENDAENRQQVEELVKTKLRCYPVAPLLAATLLCRPDEILQRASSMENCDRMLSFSGILHLLSWISDAMNADTPVKKLVNALSGTGETIISQLRKANTDPQEQLEQFRKCFEASFLREPIQRENFGKKIENELRNINHSIETWVQREREFQNRHFLGSAPIPINATHRTADTVEKAIDDVRSVNVQALVDKLLSLTRGSSRTALSGSLNFNHYGMLSVKAGYPTPFAILESVYLNAVLNAVDKSYGYFAKALGTEQGATASVLTALMIAVNDIKVAAANVIGMDPHSVAVNSSLDQFAARHAEQVRTSLRIMAESLEPSRRRDRAQEILRDAIKIACRTTGTVSPGRLDEFLVNLRNEIPKQIVNRFHQMWAHVYLQVHKTVFAGRPRNTIRTPAILRVDGCWKSLLLLMGNRTRTGSDDAALVRRAVAVAGRLSDSLEEAALKLTHGLSFLGSPRSSNLLSSELRMASELVTFPNECASLPPDSNEQSWRDSLWMMHMMDIVWGVSITPASELRNLERGTPQAGTSSSLADAISTAMAENPQYEFEPVAPPKNYRLVEPLGRLTSAFNPTGSWYRDDSIKTPLSLMGALAVLAFHIGAENYQKQTSNLRRLLYQLLVLEQVNSHRRTRIQATSADDSDAETSADAAPVAAGSSHSRLQNAHSQHRAPLSELFNAAMMDKVPLTASQAQTLLQRFVDHYCVAVEVHCGTRAASARNPRTLFLPSTSNPVEASDGHLKILRLACHAVNPCSESDGAFRDRVGVVFQPIVSDRTAVRSIPSPLSRPVSTDAPKKNSRKRPRTEDEADHSQAKRVGATGSATH